MRNKRITQLEAQVGHASDLFADRSTSTDTPSDKLKAVADKVDAISLILERLQAVPSSNSIIVNSCHQGHSNHSQYMQSSYTQTEQTLARSCADTTTNFQHSCDLCSRIFDSNDEKHGRLCEDIADQPEAQDML